MTPHSANQKAPIRVLIIAEAANPALTSVALIGWSLSSALGKIAKVHIATEIRNQDEILKHGWDPDFFTVFDNQKYQDAAFKLARFLRGGDSLGWTIYSALANLAYPAFEQKVWKHFAPQLRVGDFDLVHRITPLSPTSSSPLATYCKRINVPYLAGPLNGGLPWPKGYTHIRHKERDWLSYFRGMYKWLPGVRAMYRNATALIVGSSFTQQDIPCAPRKKIIYIPENGLDEARFPRRPLKPADGPLRVVFLGRLVPYKGADLVLNAVSALIRTGTARLDIIGDGAQMDELRRMVTEQDLGKGVQFHGWVAHEAVSNLLAECHIFAFPSIREFGGGVLLEAMAAGLVPIITDYGGPAELVPDGIGVKIPLSDPDKMVHDMHNWLLEFQSNFDKLHAMRTAAQNYVYDHFTWDAKAQQVLSVYEWILGHTSEKPNFGTSFACRPSTELERDASEK
jgi:glycosyltransferase involved in cell wall biosynthesis